MKKFIPKMIGTYFNILSLIAPRFAGNKGFFLFSSTRRKPLKDYHKAFLNTADQFNFDCNGDTIQCYRWGTGSKIVIFFHGWESHTFRWKNYINAFSKEDYTIYAMDAPGHGLSTGKYCNLPIYSNAIEKFLLRIPPAHTIITHSMGSFSSLYTFYRIPALPVKQLVITASPGEATDFMAFYKNLLGLSDRALNSVSNGFEQNTQHRPEFYSTSRFAEGISIPTLIIHDKDDVSQFEAPYKYAEVLHKKITNSILITTSGFGHNLRSPIVVQHVVDFVDQTLPDKLSMARKLENISN
jgi:pimeloyl-ACP methyl ester carboxylesterase